MRPRLLLVPGFTELEWAIAPQLAEWAEVATFDPPGVGSEPALPGGFERMNREDVARRGLREVDDRGWDRFALLADGWGLGSASLIACDRPGSIAGLALGHATMTYEVEGDSPGLNKALFDAMTDLMDKGDGSFIRYGITQMTQGGYDEELAQQMVERLSTESGAWRDVWLRMQKAPAIAADLPAKIDGPVLLAKHEGCLLYADEGWAGAVAAFPDARTLEIRDTPCTSSKFAEAIHEMFGTAA